MQYAVLVPGLPPWPSSRWWCWAGCAPPCLSSSARWSTAPGISTPNTSQPPGSGPWRALSPAGPLPFLRRGGGSGRRLLRRTNCLLSTILLAAELFGGEGLPLFALAAAVSYRLSGYTGLYSEQEIVYAKHIPREIDKKAE